MCRLLPVPATTLAYASTLERSLTDIPDAYRTRLRVQFDSVDVWLFVDEYYGRWLEVGGTYTAAHVRRVGLFYEDENVVSGSYATPLITETNSSAPDTLTYTLAIDHPYAASAGAYADQTRSDTLTFHVCDSNGCSGAVHPFYIVSYLGDAGEGQENAYARIAAGKFLPLQFDNLSLRTARRFVWRGDLHDPRQYGLSRRSGALASAVVARDPPWTTQWVGSAPTSHHTLGIALEIIERSGTHGAAIDAQSVFSVSSLSGDAAGRATAARTDAQILSLFEGSAQEQSEDAQRLDGDCILVWSGQPTLRSDSTMYPSANIATALAASVHYSTDEQQLAQAYAAGGYNLILGQRRRRWHVRDKYVLCNAKFWPAACFYAGRIVLAFTSSRGGKGASMASLFDPMDACLPPKILLSISKSNPISRVGRWVRASTISCRAAPETALYASICFIQPRTAHATRW